MMCLPKLWYLTSYPPGANFQRSTIDGCQLYVVMKLYYYVQQLLLCVMSLRLQIFQTHHQFEILPSGNSSFVLNYAVLYSYIVRILIFYEARYNEKRNTAANYMTYTLISSITSASYMPCTVYYPCIIKDYCSTLEGACGFWLGCCPPTYTSIFPGKISHFVV